MHLHLSKSWLQCFPSTLLAGGLADWITVHSQYVASMFTPLLSCGDYQAAVRSQEKSPFYRWVCDGFQKVESKAQGSSQLILENEKVPTKFFLPSQERQKDGADAASVGGGSHRGSDRPARPPAGPQPAPQSFLLQVHHLTPSSQSTAQPPSLQVHHCSSGCPSPSCALHVVHGYPVSPLVFLVHQVLESTMWPTSRLIRVPRLDCAVCHPASARTLQCSLTFGLQSRRANQTAAALIGQWCEQTNQWESPDTTKLSVPTNTLTYDDSTRGRHRGYRAHS